MNSSIKNVERKIDSEINALRELLSSNTTPEMLAKAVEGKAEYNIKLRSQLRMAQSENREDVESVQRTEDKITRLIMATNFTREKEPKLAMYGLEKLKNKYS